MVGDSLFFQLCLHVTLLNTKIVITLNAMNGFPQHRLRVLHTARPHVAPKAVAQAHVDDFFSQIERCVPILSGVVGEGRGVVGEGRGARVRGEG